MGIGVLLWRVDQKGREHGGTGTDMLGVQIIEIGPVWVWNVRLALELAKNEQRSMG